MANGLTVSRALLGLACHFFVLTSNTQAFSLMFPIGIATDQLDGYVARKTKSVTFEGELRDIMADLALYSSAIIGIFKTIIEDPQKYILLINNLLGNTHNHLVLTSTDAASMTFVASTVGVSIATVYLIKQMNILRNINSMSEEELINR